MTFSRFDDEASAAWSSVVAWEGEDRSSDETECAGSEASVDGFNIPADGD